MAVTDCVCSDIQKSTGNPGAGLWFLWFIKNKNLWGVKCSLEQEARLCEEIHKLHIFIYKCKMGHLIIKHTKWSGILREDTLSIRLTDCKAEAYRKHTAHWSDVIPKRREQQDAVYQFISIRHCATGHVCKTLTFKKIKSLIMFLCFWV